MALPKKFKTAINHRIAAAAFWGVAAASSAGAQTIPFNGHELNCATLQGAQDPIPGGMTCGFVEEVEQYFYGPKLTCDPDEVGYSPVALQTAARHLDTSHGQPALYGYTQTMIAGLNANRNGTQVTQELQITNPGEAQGLFATYLAIEGTTNRMRAGASFETAAAQTSALMNRRGDRLPNSSGSTVQDITALFNNNPVMAAYTQCSAVYPEQTWDHLLER